MRRMVCACLGAVAISAMAEQPIRILETAPLGTSNGGTAISASQHLGARFELSSPTLVSGVGGHVKSHGTEGENRTIFVAAVPVGGPMGFPSDTTLSQAVFAITLDPPYNLVGPYPYQVQETILPSNFVVPAGHYAVVFGSGQFGATGSAWMPVSGPIQSLPWFFSMNRYIGDYWRNLNEQPMRFVVEGVPGVDQLLPATLKGPVLIKGKGPARATIVVIGSTAFDATQVDAMTLKFGTNEEPARSYKIRDVNKDGMADLEVTFQTRSLSGTERRALVQGLDFSGNAVAGFVDLAF